jgi:hypothetical protein
MRIEAEMSHRDSLSVQGRTDAINLREDLILSPMPRQKPPTMFIIDSHGRIADVFRPEEGTWKVVHRHADPITTEQAAESIIQR